QKVRLPSLKIIDSFTDHGSSPANQTEFIFVLFVLIKSSLRHIAVIFRLFVLMKASSRHTASIVQSFVATYKFCRNQIELCNKEFSFDTIFNEEIRSASFFAVSYFFRSLKNPYEVLSFIRISNMFLYLLFLCQLSNSSKSYRSSVCPMRNSSSTMITILPFFTPFIAESASC